MGLLLVLVAAKAVCAIGGLITVAAKKAAIIDQMASDETPSTDEEQIARARIAGNKYADPRERAWATHEYIAKHPTRDELKQKLYGF